MVVGCQPYAPAVFTARRIIRLDGRNVSDEDSASVYWRRRKQDAEVEETAL
jgi:hypothetical protein